jgi:hypothetical protein
MPNLKEIDESQYKVDFEILKGYIDFSSVLLRLSLLAMGSFGALILIKSKGEAKDTLPQFLQQPALFIIAMGLFALCSGATLFHRYFASDSMSWYIYHRHFILFIGHPPINKKYCFQLNNYCLIYIWRVTIDPDTTKIPVV